MIMSQVQIDGKNYDLDSLSDDAKKNLASLRFVQTELQRLEAKVAVFKTSEAAYSSAIKKLLPESD